MDSRSQELIKQGDYLFGRRQSSGLDSFWQTVAENFYVERADFTTTRNTGEDFAAHLTTSYPLLASRDLYNTVSAMLRPSNQDWFGISTLNEDKLNFADKRWLEWATKRQRTIMYDKRSQFVRATKEGDRDFTNFGQTVIELTRNNLANGLLYRCWHLRDVVWSESYDGEVDTVHRKWKPTAIELANLFYLNRPLPPKMQAVIDKDPYARIECRHIVLPTDKYNTKGPSGKKWKQPFMSVYINVEFDDIMEEVGQWDLGYVIPRWQTVSGSQYAHSPCTVVALPDARLIQSVSLTLLEAGEKAVTPPMVAVQEAIRSDISLYAAGITYVDSAYDERLGEVLRPITQDKNGIPFGMEMQKDIRDMISQAFYLDKLNLPPAEGPNMTAYEVSQRIQQYIRHALPLFEPLEADYNGALCEMTFNRLQRMGAFGNPQDMPDGLSGQQIQFKFTSPLTEAIGKDKGQKFVESMGLLTQAAQLDPSAKYRIDAGAALKDVLTGIQTPALWIRDDDQVAALAQQDQQNQEDQSLLNSAEQGSNVVKNLGGIQAFQPSEAVQ